MDIFIMLSLVVLNSAMGYMGVHLTLHPPSLDKEKRRWKIGFISCTVVAAVLIIWQGVRGNRAQNLITEMISKQGDKIDSIRTDSERPIQITIPPPHQPVKTAGWILLEAEPMKPIPPVVWSGQIWSRSNILQPVHLKLWCSGSLADVTEVKMTTGEELGVVHPNWKVSDKGKALELTFEGPAISTMNPLGVKIIGKSPVIVTRVDGWKSD